METVLQQNEIDALVRAARGRGSSPTSVSRWDCHQAGMGREQLNAIGALHEGFARNLTNSIGAYLRIGFQAGLASAEHVSYREFLGAIPEKSYLASVRLEPVGAAALVQMDLAIAFPLIDVLLGGEGMSEAPSREITEIEEQILETIVRILCRELQNAWQPLGINFAFEQRQQPGRVQHLLPVEEKTLGLSFELTMKNCRGLMSVAVPAVMSSALLRRISAAGPRAQVLLGAPDSGARLRRRLLRCQFRFELQLKLQARSASEIADLKLGDILVFNRRTDGLADIACAGRQIFEARTARIGNLRAAQIGASLREKFPWKESNRGEVSQERPHPSDSDTILTITVSGTVTGELIFRVPQPSALQLLQVFMREEKAPAELTPEGRSGLEELFRQVAGYVAASLKPTLPDVGLAVALSSMPTHPAEAVS